MSFATTAAATLFADARTAQQTVATNTPVAAAAARFANFLAEKHTAKPSAAGFAPTPDMLAQTLFGTAYDRGTGKVQLDRITGEAMKRSAEFAGQLRNRLAEAGIDPNTPIALSLGAEGRVIVDGSHPHADAIAKIFAEDPALAQAFRNVAARNDHAAILQVGAAYVKEWQEAGNDAERGSLWKRYSTLINNVAGTFSGRITFGPGTVISESQQIVRRMALT